MRFQSLDPRNVKPSSLLFIFGLLALFIREGAHYITLLSIADSTDKLLLIIGSVLLFLYVISRIHCHSRWCFVVAGILLTLGALIYIESSESVAFQFLIIICAASYLPHPFDCFKLITFLSSLLACCLISFFLVSIVLNPDSAPYILREDGQSIRYTLFFTHPNVASLFFCMTGASLLCLIGPRNKYRASFLFCLFAVFIFMLTDSRTVLIISILFVLAYLIPYDNESISKHVARFVACMPPLFGSALYLFSGPLFLDDFGPLLNHRVMLSHSAIINLGTPPFGTSFRPTTYTGVDGIEHWCKTIDCGYIYALVVLGVVYTTLLLSLFVITILSKRDCKEMTFPLLLMLAISCVTEVHALYFFISVPLLILASGLSNIFIWIDNRFKEQECPNPYLE